MRFKFEIPTGVKEDQVFILRETTKFQFKEVTEDFYDNKQQQVKEKKVKQRVKVLGTKMETIKGVRSIEEAISKIKHIRTVAAAAWVGKLKEDQEVKPHMIVESGEFINQLKPV